MGHEKNHASEHTDGTDDLQSATNAQKGVATAAQIISLENATDGFDVIEHFQRLLTFLPEDGAANDVYNNKFIFETGTPTKDSASVLKMTAGASATAFLQGLVTVNPADHTYLEFRWKYKQQTAAANQAYTVVIGDPTDTNYAEIGIVDASNIEITIDNGVTTDTVTPIAHDLTVDSEFCLKIKSGEIKFYIDDVLKATFTTDGLWYDVTAGVKYYIGLDNGDVGFAKYFLIDYAHILAGRPF